MFGPGAERCVRAPVPVCVSLCPYFQGQEATPLHSEQIESHRTASVSEGVGEEKEEDERERYRY